MKKLIFILMLILFGCSKEDEPKCIDCIQTTIIKSIHHKFYAVNSEYYLEDIVLKVDNTKETIKTFCDASEYELTVSIPQFEIDNSDGYRENILMMPHQSGVIEEYKYDSIIIRTNCK